MLHRLESVGHLSYPGCYLRQCRGKQRFPTLSRSKAILKGASYAVCVIDGASNVCGIADHCVKALCASTCTVWTACGALIPLCTCSLHAIPSPSTGTAQEQLYPAIRHCISAHSRLQREETSLPHTLVQPVVSPHIAVACRVVAELEGSSCVYPKYGPPCTRTPSYQTLQLRGCLSMP